MYALEIEKLSKTYANGVEALKDLSLSIKKGDFFALLGANGAGKSTTIGLITSLITKSTGTIRIHGFDLTKQSAQAKTCLGLVPQEINLNVFETGEQILLSQAGYYGISRKQAKTKADELLKQLGLWEKRKEMTRHLSGGMKRRLMIARALIHEPKVLILDEPTAGIDIELRHSLWKFLTRINQEGTTIILTTHYLEEAEHLCRNIAIIDKGKIVSNTSMQALLKTLHHQTFIFNSQMAISHLPDLSPCNVALIDEHTFELGIDNSLSLNEIFSLLTKNGIIIQSMRNKTNRLEELFLDLIKNE